MKSPIRSPHAPGNPQRGRAYDRHSASGSRGLPKKGGAGGKGVWGAMMDESAPAVMDKNDPNYDSDPEVEAEPPLMSLATAIPPAPAPASAPSSAPSSQ